MVITGVGGVSGIGLAYLVSIAVGRIPFYSELATHAEDADIRLIISPISVVVATGILIVTGLVRRHDSRHPRGQPRPYRIASLRIEAGLRPFRADC